jgi:hypothetical protein
VTFWPQKGTKGVKIYHSHEKAQKSQKLIENVVYEFARNNPTEYQSGKGNENRYLKEVSILGR